MLAPAWPVARSSMTHGWQITIAVILVMVVVVASYRQNVRAYPSGGGDYEVAATVQPRPHAAASPSRAPCSSTTCSRWPVSVSSGVQVPARSSVSCRATGGRRWGGLLHRDEPPRRARVGQGLRRAGLVFMLAILGMGIYGFIQQFTGTLAPAESAGLTLLPEDGQELTGIAAAFLLLRAFSSGCAALTGVEAISNGVPAFQKPKSDNAAATLMAMGALSIAMLASIITLSQWTGIKIADDPAKQLTRNGQPVGDDYIQHTAIGQLPRPSSRTSTSASSSSPSSPDSSSSSRPTPPSTASRCSARSSP